MLKKEFGYGQVGVSTHMIKHGPPSGAGDTKESVDSMLVIVFSTFSGIHSRSFTERNVLTFDFLVSSLHDARHFLNRRLDPSSWHKKDDMRKRKHMFSHYINQTSLYFYTSYFRLR